MPSIDENNVRLAKCQYHVFTPVLGGRIRLCICSRCGGIIHAKEAMWYAQGQQHEKLKRKKRR